MKHPHLFAVIFSTVLLITHSALAIVHGRGVEGSRPLGVLALESLNSAGERVDICTGIMISPNVFLTAAHCVNGGGFGISKIDDKLLAQPILVAQAKVQVAPSLDLALGLVEGAKEIAFSKIDPRVGLPENKFEIRGYGVDQNDVDSIVLPPAQGLETERSGIMNVFSMDWNLVTFRSRATEDAYAVASDSGAPILNENDELVGLFVDFKMLDDLDQWGNCYLQNQAIRVNSPAAQSFISQAQAHLGQ